MEKALPKSKYGREYTTSNSIDYSVETAESEIHLIESVARGRPPATSVNESFKLGFRSAPLQHGLGGTSSRQSLQLFVMSIWDPHSLLQIKGSVATPGLDENSQPSSINRKREIVLR